jgi:hypothetical protein
VISCQVPGRQVSRRGACGLRGGALWHGGSGQVVDELDGSHPLDRADLVAILQLGWPDVVAAADDDVLERIRVAAVGNERRERIRAEHGPKLIKRRQRPRDERAADPHGTGTVTSLGRVGQSRMNVGPLSGAVAALVRALSRVTRDHQVQPPLEQSVDVVPCRLFTPRGEVRGGL